MTTTTPNHNSQTFHGHPNWDYWNVFFWLSEDYRLYKYATDLIKANGIQCAVTRVSEHLEGSETPDGAKYTKATIEHAVIHLADLC
jgi:hypothetical protein